MELIGELITVTTGLPSPWLYRSRLPKVSVKEEDIKVVKQTQQLKDYRPVATIHLKARNDLDFPSRVVSTTIMAPEYHEMKPAELDRGPIPVHNIWREHAYILPRAMFAPMLQQASYFVFPGFQWPIWMAYTIYFFSFAEFLLGTVRRLESFALLYGTFDERAIGRDRTPDYSIPQLCRAFLSFLILRTAGEFALKWDASEQPFSNFNLTTLPRMFIWLIVMDYFFYVWHRSSHQIPWLWKLHQEHHTTKHPSPALSILAEGPQEVIEILVVPLCATLLVPLSFHELFVLMCYTSYVEIFGHTGIRADWKLPITGFVLQPFGLELMGEDHDLHHRYGKSGKNFGKQSRVWDVLFNSTGDREECRNLPGHRPY